jgi:ABC-type Fe3+ transport system permease subunit
MLDEFSKYRDIGRSSAVAVLIFVCVLPVIIGSALKRKGSFRTHDSRSTQKWYDKPVSKLIIVTIALTWMFPIFGFVLSSFQPR